VIEPIYNYVQPFKNGLAIVATGGNDPRNAATLMGVINTEGEVVIPLVYKHIFHTVDENGVSYFWVTRAANSAQIDYQRLPIETTVNDGVWGVIVVTENASSITRENVAELCDICGVEKSWRITTVHDNGEVVTQRRAAKRDSAGALLGACEPISEPLSYEELYERVKQDWIGGDIRYVDYFKPTMFMAFNNTAVYFNNPWEHIHYPAYWNEVVAGYAFRYHNCYYDRGRDRVYACESIKVWHDGEFYTLGRRIVNNADVSQNPDLILGDVILGAYELGLLTRDDIAEIHARFLER